MQGRGSGTPRHSRVELKAHFVTAVTMQTLHIIHLEDQQEAPLLWPSLPPSVKVLTATDMASFHGLLQQHQPVGVISPASLWGHDAALLLGGLPGVAGFVLTAPDVAARLAHQWLDAGALDVISSADDARLRVALRHLSSVIEKARADALLARRARLVDVVQQLSMTRSLTDVMAIVRRAARELGGADGATFVLRDREQCYYADEDAISPLWKGQRFSIRECISGVAMLTQAPVIIEDIYEDERVPHAAYAVTFVRSLLMVPIRAEDPIGAIGTYWATKRHATAEDVELMQALANATALTIENVGFQKDLERRVAERTEDLARTNQELEAFSSSVSHDLRNRLNAILGFSSLLDMQARPHLDVAQQEYIHTIRDCASQMKHTISDLMTLARAGRQEVEAELIDVSELARQSVTDLRQGGLLPAAEVTIEPGLMAYGDTGLLRLALDNLLSNAFKYSSKQSHPRVVVGARRSAPADQLHLFIQDNGAGFDPQHASRLFQPFVRLHEESDFPGTGLGLTIVRRAIERLGGTIAADSQPGLGTTFRVMLPRQRGMAPCAATTASALL